MSLPLDWREYAHWGGGAPSTPTSLDDARPCRVCGKPALLVDDHKRPCHKVCAEREVVRR